MSEERPALLVIDVQKGLDERGNASRSTPRAEANIARLLEVWRASELPIVHVQHCSTERDSALRPDRPGHVFKDEALPLPGEKIVPKRVNSAFVGTDLEVYLTELGVTKLVVVGLTTDHCVSASTRSASDLGFDVTVVSDATAAFGRKGFDGASYTGEDIHRVNLVSLDGEFCAVRSTQAVLAALPAKSEGARQAASAGERERAGDTEVTLRRAGLNEIDQLAPMVAAFHELESIPSSEAGRRAAIRTLLEDPALGGVWLVVCGGRVAGYVALCRGYSLEFGGYDAFVDELYLMPDLRGQGLGRRTLELIKLEAAQLGIQALHLEVATDNTRAASLYATSGFVARDGYVLMTADLE